jgi:hypothetical protein
LCLLLFFLFPWQTQDPQSLGSDCGYGGNWCNHFYTGVLHIHEFCLGNWYTAPSILKTLQILSRLFISPHQPVLSRMAA